MKPESNETPKPTIAVVDDCDSVRCSLGEALAGQGYSVELFDSAEAALAWPGLLEVDCVVADLRLPGPDGERLIEVLQGKRFAPAVVVISDRGNEKAAVRCLRAGAYHFAKKPLEDTRFLACVAQAVERTGLLRERRRLMRQLGLRSEEAEDPRHVSRPRRAGRLHLELERTEKSVIEATLRRNRGEISASARALGISRRALFERMRKYHLSKEDYRKGETMYP